MAFTSPFTAVTGATITAASHNTSYRDNLNAIWIYTQAGSISYSTSASVLAELQKPSAANSLLYMTTAGIPAWASIQRGIINTTTNFATTSATNVDITGLTLTLNLPNTVSTWTVFAWMSGSFDSSISGVGAYVSSSINGVDDSWLVYTSFNGNTTAFGYCYFATGVPNGSRIVKGRAASGSGGVTINIRRAQLIALALPE